MVQLRYKGQNTLFVGGYALKAGFNEMKDEDFYKLMKNSKTFKLRVDQKILEVPAGFPLEKPVKEKPVSPSQPSDSQADDAEEKDEEQGDRLSVKATLKLIEKSDDADYLQGLIDKDTRPKVIEEAKKKLKALKS